MPGGGEAGDDTGCGNFEWIVKIFVDFAERYRYRKYYLESVSKRQIQIKGNK